MKLKRKWTEKKHKNLDKKRYLLGTVQKTLHKINTFIHSKRGRFDNLSSIHVFHHSISVQLGKISTLECTCFIGA